MGDWHPEDIKAEVRKRGGTLAQIARRLGVSGQSVTAAINGRTSERCERAIAEYKADPKLHWQKSEPSLEDVFIELMNRAKDNFQ